MLQNINMDMQFYLNYVGCKVFQQEKVSLLYCSFTLTMWDVKYCSTSFGLTVLFSFTLTMWDVKSKYWTQSLQYRQFYLNYVGCKEVLLWANSENVKWFYLNYVGCKGNTWDVNFVRCSSFTLTMWDVKIVSFFSSLFFVLVLP